MRPLQYSSPPFPREPFRYRARFGLSALLLLPLSFLIVYGYWVFAIPMSHLSHHVFFHLVLTLLTIGFGFSLFGLACDRTWWISLLTALFYANAYGLVLYVYPLTFLFADR